MSVERHFCIFVECHSLPATGGAKWAPPAGAYNAFLLALSNCVGRPQQRPSAAALSASSTAASASSSSSSAMAGSGAVPLTPSSSTAVTWHDIDENVRDARRMVCEMVDVGVVPTLATLIGTSWCLLSVSSHGRWRL